ALPIYAMKRPSGDHTGCPSKPGSKVNLVLAPLVRSTIHRSSLPACRGSVSTTTALVPSGDTFIVPYGARSPGRPTMSPCRLNHVSWRLLPVTVRYTSVPFVETEKRPSAPLG